MGFNSAFKGLNLIHDARTHVYKMLRIVTWDLELGRILWNDLGCSQKGENRRTVVQTGMKLRVL